MSRFLKTAREGYQDLGLCRLPKGDHLFSEDKNISTEERLPTEAKPMPPATTTADSSFYKAGTEKYLDPISSNILTSLSISGLWLDTK